MKDTRRDQIEACVIREFIGPDPIDQEGYITEAGEEILHGDPPRVRYIAGVLFPRETEIVETDLKDGEEQTEQMEFGEPEGDNGERAPDREIFADPDQAEELINRSNAYHQSAMSITCAVRSGCSIVPTVKAAIYLTFKGTDPKTGKETVRYERAPIEWNNDGKPITLPKAGDPPVCYPIENTHLQFDITWRYQKDEASILTFTLENASKTTGPDSGDATCYFQVEFSLVNSNSFSPMPGRSRINTNDEDWLSNQLLYRKVKNYAIGHGCAADWEETAQGVFSVKTVIFPSWEVKPIIPSSIPGVVLSMYELGPKGDIEHIVAVLNLLCDRYSEWIEGLNQEKDKLNGDLQITATRHIKNCHTCLERMRDGIKLLKTNAMVQTAFQYMNLAMLEQQLHYNIPLQLWNDSNKEFDLVEPVTVLPDPDDPETWPGKDKGRFGKWRPFQLAFILMNLRSMAEPECSDRKIVDLIWFPTGGGKTEAYLGLSAYTIFIRRLKNHDDSGTSILMRYTLRLLTAQQYERASAMICACDLIRKEHEDLFGAHRINIGLWVGGDTTPNHMKDAVHAYELLYNGKTEKNPFVILKCPWCGAQMGPLYKRGKSVAGYTKIIGAHGAKRFAYVCDNKKHGCPFSSTSYPLPLHIVDDEIYETTPTLILGTVDKFAMLPFRPQAQALFGYENGIKKTSPDLIIQDELHLISGPLGSMVGLYETMIDELCSKKSGNAVIKPKIVASTATISRARAQCHALYNCGEENVFQFPPSGLDAGKSFFAEEDENANGRRYIGVMANASSSDMTTAIRLYSALLYAAKDIKVEDQSERDPSWTNMGYYNSIRELGQAQTWINADIEQYLDTMYKRRNLQKLLQGDEYQKARRYIYKHEELTSRIAGDKVTASLSNLGIKYGAKEGTPIDICLATNMISVGLDVQRLGLMTVTGQPKTTSEYIQATSRVGRNSKDAPGIIFIIYRPGRPRDRSHYEHFREYHSKLYCSVEPTSVTPFSAPVRDRALHAIMVGMMRLEQGSTYNQNPPKLPDKEMLSHVEQVIRKRIDSIDPEESDAAAHYMTQFMENWEAWHPALWEPKLNPNGSFADELPLIFPWGRERNVEWGETRGKETPTSMRNVDAECEAKVLEQKYAEEDE